MCNLSTFLLYSGVNKAVEGQHILWYLLISQLFYFNLNPYFFLYTYR